MKKYLTNKGFTLIEMLIVLFIITVLILIAIPNVTKHFATVNNKGCEAYVKVVQGQVESYRLEVGKYPTTISEMEDKGYLKKDNTSCGNKAISIESDGYVKVTE